MRSERASQAADAAEAALRIARNQQRLIDLIDAACASDTPPDLVVFPEFAMQGPPLHLGVAEWIARACSAIPGPLTAPLQDLARRRGIFIAGNMFEAPPEWPGRYFNSSFLIDDRGEIILNYRRVNTAAFPSVHDFMTDYLAATPQAQVFPVVETRLGRLALIPCGEINVPEVARVMMMQGAEIILHPTNSKYSAAQEAAKLCRVAENMVYLVSANVAGPIGFSPDDSIAGGRSHIIDPHGETLAFEESADESIGVTALIDVAALRRDRRIDTGLSNPLLRARYEMYVPYYEAARFYPPDSFRAAPMADTMETRAVIARARLNMERAGILAPLPPGQAEPTAPSAH